MESSAPLASENAAAPSFITPGNQNNKYESEILNNIESSGNFTSCDSKSPKKNNNNNKKIEVEVLSENDVANDLTYKIIVIGDSGVGKSCLSLRATKDIFKEEFVSTVGTELFCFKVKINNKKIKLQIWDTCGQEAYKSLIASFYRNSSLAVIVYAINNVNSFNNVNEWLKQIKSNASPNCRIFLIGNKVDLPDRKISTDMGKKLKKDFDFDFFMETSAKSGFNAKEMFINIACILYKDYLLQIKGDNKVINEDRIINKAQKNFDLKDKMDNNEDEDSCC